MFSFEETGPFCTISVTSKFCFIQDLMAIE
jgi:hypothetical protein